MLLYLNKNAPLLTKKEMRSLGSLPAIRGYVKEGYPKRKNDGCGSIAIRYLGPIEYEYETRDIDVYESLRGIIVGYAELSDGTFVGVVRPAKKILATSAVCAAVVTGAAWLCLEAYNCHRKK